MKNIFAFLLLLISLCAYSNGIPDGSTWSYIERTFLRDKIMFKEGDTIIDNKDYAKIKLLQKVVPFLPYNDDYYVVESEFFIRYDNDSMFYLSDSSEVLLWTFRANINDTLNFGVRQSGFGCDSSTHIITGKGKMLVNNDSLQWIDIKPLSFTGFGYNETRIFEHLGPVYDNWFLPEGILCENLTAVPEFPYYNVLCCGNALLGSYPYVDKECSKEFIVTNVNDIDEIQIKYFPNPASQYVYIETNNTNAYECQIFDVVGNEVSSSVLVDGNLTKIDLNNLGNGYHLLKITDSKKNLTSTKKLFIYK